jgi:arylsulfatase A-like enzyme
MLHKQPDYDNTIVVVLADHGEQFGVHALYGHGNSLFRQLLHVPMILKIPGRAPGRVSSPVTIADLHDTLLEAAGVQRRNSPELALFDPARRRPAVAEYLNGPTGSETFSAANDRYHLIVALDNRRTLFDYTSDPFEIHPLPDLDGIAATELHTHIDAARREWDGTRSTAAMFRSLGYLE